MNITARNFAYAFGLTYLLVGLIGFGLTGFSDFAASDGHVLVVFEVNPLHNIVHLLIGGALFFAARAGEAVSRKVVALIAAAYAAVGVLGLFIVNNPSLNILALNHPDNVLHLVTAAGGALVLMASSRRTAAA